MRLIRIFLFSLVISLQPLHVQAQDQVLPESHLEFADIAMANACKFSADSNLSWPGCIKIYILYSHRYIRAMEHGCFHNFLS